VELRSLTVLLTDQCNFDCTYCYQQQGENYLDFSYIAVTLDFFFDCLEDGSTIDFSGGEPLLAFDLIEKTINYIGRKNSNENKPLRYSITTNGSLLDGSILNFLESHRFYVVLSYDGLNQETARHPGSRDQIEKMLPRLLSSPNIELNVNTVIPPSCSGDFYRSVVYMLDKGIQDINLAFSFHEPWSTAQLLHLKEELVELREVLGRYYKTHDLIPIENFREPSGGVFSCHAGQDRISLSQDGKIWGCYLYSDYFKGREDSPDYSKYCFGYPEEFFKNFDTFYEDKLSNYESISRKYRCTFSSMCRKCGEWLSCAVCPMDIAFSNSFEGKIPSWVCEINKMLAAERTEMWRQIRGF
jgi:uncharacterized protein